VTEISFKERATHEYEVVGDGKYHVGIIERAADWWKFYPNQGGFELSELKTIVEFMNKLESEFP
jgi:hypothetical protein